MSPIHFNFALNIIQSSGLYANRIVLVLFALELGAPALIVGVLTALFSLAPATLAVTVGRLADRFGARWLMVTGSTGAGLGLLLPRMISWLKEEKMLALSFCSGAAALLLIPMFEHPLVLGLLAFMFGMGMGGGQPIVTMLIFQFSPARRSGEAIGLKITANHLTNMVSPVVFGGFATAFGLLPMFWLNGLMMAAGSYISWSRRGR